MTIESSISPAAPGTYRLTNSAIVAGAKVECQVNGVVWLRKQPENEIAKPSPAVAIAVAERKLMLVALLPQKKQSRKPVAVPDPEPKIEDVV